MNKKFESLDVFILLVIVLCISACGGNNQSNETRKGTPPLYTGISNPAPITANNAQALTTGAIIGANTVGSPISRISSSVSGETFESQEQSAINKNLLKFLFGFAKTVEIKSTKNIDEAISVAAIKNESILGDCGGEFSYKLNVNDISGSFTGNFVFNNFCTAGTTINGSYPVDGVYVLLTDEFETINEHITNLTINNIVQTGEVSTDFRGYPPLISILSDLYNRNSSTGKTYWVNDYTISILDVGTGLEINLSGRYYDPDFGYVDVSTTTPFFFDYTDEWPRSGVLLCSGLNSKAILTVLDASSYFVDADRNGDGIYEFNIGPFFWEDL